MEVGEEGLVMIVSPSVASHRDRELVGAFSLCNLGPRQGLFIYLGTYVRKLSTEVML